MFSWLNKKKLDLESLEISIDKMELRKRARIVIIDDEEVQTVEDLRREGYTIEQWRTIPSIKELEDRQFDLIILDICGVGIGFSKDEGFGVLRHLRESGCNSKIIAYSGQTFNPVANEFFSQADATIPKDAGIIDWMRKIDELLKEKFSIKNYRDFIRNYCKTLAISESDRNKLENLIVESIKNKDEKAQPAISRISSIISDMDVQKSMILAITQLVTLGIEASSNGVS